MENYNITLAYKAVLSVGLKANSREEAEEKGLEIFKKQRGFKNKNITIEDDTFSVEGILNMSSTWETL